jgi:hypothetical protein
LLKDRSSFLIQKSHVRQFTERSRFSESSSNRISGKHLLAVSQSIDDADPFVEVLSLFEKSPIAIYSVVVYDPPAQTSLKTCHMKKPFDTLKDEISHDNIFVSLSFPFSQMVDIIVVWFLVSVGSPFELSGIVVHDDLSRLNGPTRGKQSRKE